VPAPAAARILTGDIEREQEAALVAAHGARCAATSSLRPHHGSRTSSTAAFLEAVAPAVAVFQAGYRNRFGHPAADVLERYRRAASPSSPARNAGRGCGTRRGRAGAASAISAAATGITAPRPRGALRRPCARCRGAEFATLAAGGTMAVAFDEMRDGGRLVREHYRGYERWLPSSRRTSCARAARRPR
jgi:hypothetical protein